MKQMLITDGMQTMSLVRENYRDLQDNKALKIGLHIRYGDDYLKGAPQKGPCWGDVRDKTDWWSCAQEIEDQYRLPGQRVIW